ncbi:MAG: adenylate/guanylate cyclase domain-containing protein [Caldimonas sp.]
MPSRREQLEGVIKGLESQRPLLGDAVVEAALAPLRAELTALAGRRDDEQSLKHVTVLFLDVVGSTALAQHLDAEDLHAVIDRTLASGTAIVESHGGQVLQYAGDSVLAVFGAERTREDDAERAVRAGLALLDEGRQQGEQVLHEHRRAGFDVRVGIHSGGVLLGGGVGAQSSIRGLTVHLAARMEQSAPAGGLRISHDTYRHVRGAFDVQPQAPMTVKGLDEPIVTYLVLRARPRAFRVASRGIEGVDTRMVGRGAELGLLQDAWRRVVDEQRLVAVTVVADAGIGKSRLLYEFQNWAEADAQSFFIFQGRAEPQTRDQPYGLLRDLFARRMLIADGDGMALARKKLVQGVAPLFEADEGHAMAEANAHLLGHLIGIDFADSKHVAGIRDDTRQIRNRAFHAAAQVMRRMAAQNATRLVLLLEDLHWADEASLDFLDHLVRVNSDVPMLVLMLTRPTLFERRAGFPGLADVQRIELGPLGLEASKVLVDELLKMLPEIPAALRDLLIGRAGGNPFYMEELVKMLVDVGAIEIGAQRWAVNPARLAASQVPQTLTGVLQARLDGLQPAEKLALQQASVIGVVFWDQALGAIDTAATDALPGVTRRQLVEPHKDTLLEGAREFAFRHQLLQQVTYDTLLKRLRAGYHHKVARWLAGLTSARAGAFLGVTADHFEKAGDRPEACRFFRRAALHAAERHANEAALGYVERALALIDPGDGTAEERWQLVQMRERTLDLMGRRAEQRTDIDELVRLADALDDDGRRAEAAWRHCDLALRTGDFGIGASMARQAMALAEQSGDLGLRLRAQHRLASALAQLGDVAQSKVLARDGLAEVRSLGLRSLESLFLNAVVMAASAQDDHVAALAAAREQLPINRELGNRRAEATTLLNIGALTAAFGEDGQAKPCMEAALSLARSIGDRLVEANSLIQLSQGSLRQGDAAAALVHARTALAIGVAIKSRHSEGYARHMLGNAALALGQLALAQAEFEGAHAIALAIGLPLRHDALAGLARVALAGDDVAAAMTAVESLLNFIAEGGTLDGADSALIRLTCYRVLLRAGDRRAADLLTAAHDDVQTRAAAIADPALRDTFMNAIAEHRDIVAAFVLQAHGA